MCNCLLLFHVLRLFVDGFLNAVNLRIYGPSVIKAILREPQFPDRNLELVHECFGEQQVYEIRKTDEEGKSEAWVWKEKRARKKSPDGLSHLNQNIIIIKKIW